MATPKTILVTGCAGFIGSNFVKQFKKQFPKTTIVGIDNLSTGKKQAIDPSVKFYKGSILNNKLLEKVFHENKPEYVFHFAALPRISYSVQYPRESSEVNIIGTVALLNASKNHGVKRFIYSSSSSVYGGSKKLPTKESENHPHPRSPYAVQKYIGEPLCRVFSDLFGLDTVVLRYFNVFGPGQYGNAPYSSVISSWLESIFFPSNKEAFLEGNGHQSRDFCYVDNVVQANILAATSNRRFNGEIFNIANGERVKVKDVKKMIEKYTKKKLSLKKCPPRPGDVKHSHADISKAKKILGYRPIVTFSEGLQKTVDWFETRKA